MSQGKTFAGGDDSRISAAVRNGWIARLKTTAGKDHRGMLSLLFAQPDARPKALSRDRLSGVFDEGHLALLAQRRTGRRGQCRFLTFVER